MSTAIRIGIVTVSDRASAGIYEDEGGPAIQAYFDKALGDVPVDFMSDLHITNGNSGSATLNARGELVGLAFDGTFESVASDWAFVPTTRTIHVDLRFILYLLQDVDHAQSLLSELGVQR